MIFAAPWVLLALALLPLLWWLLRVTPPAPRREIFPAIRLLMGLAATEEVSARTPWWLLALRMLAAGLAIVGLARPVLDAGRQFAGSGPLLLVIDDGWASAPDWSARLAAANVSLVRAERGGRMAALLTTAPPIDGQPVAPPQVLPIADLRARVAALRPKPWATDRAAAAAALADWKKGSSSVAYIADGVAGAPDADAAFARTLANLGPVTELRQEQADARLLLPPRVEADRLIVQVTQPPRPVASPDAVVLAQSGDGHSLARVSIAIAPGQGRGEAGIALPPELRNQLGRLVLEGPPSAASVVLLDERWRRRPVGLLAGDAVAAESPLIGQLYYLRRALSPYTEIRESDLNTLLARDLSVLILADRVIADGPEHDAITAWVAHGGTLIRFAGPRMAEHPDSLLPVHLLEGDRQLGGAMSWSQPARLAPFAPGSLFEGLKIADEVRVTRQVLAQPAADLSQHSWASLVDGTPLVTEATRGAGRVILFHVTANADWSNLPLSGLFVDMLRRVVALSTGVADTADTAVLAPSETLDGFGQLGAPPPAATGLAASAFATTPASPRHPPGLYGPESGRRVLNLSANLPPPVAAAEIPGAHQESLGRVAQERPLGPWLMALALALLAIDLVVSLFLRGLLGRPRIARGAVAALALALAWPATGHAADDTASRYPALATRLGYIVTGDDQIDGVSRAGLAGLSDYVNRRTAAVLAAPAPVTPGEDDMSFYPLLYWPVTGEAAPPSATAIAALNAYMGNGGIILLDTRNSGSGEGFSPGADAALQRATEALSVPPLAPLTSEHVLARSFYLLQDFPGRFDGGMVWVQRDQDRANDSVSPVVIGGNDWAAAWAVDDAGHNPYATIPGGSRQRTLAYRFGVNLVMYALTGNYKGDQVHVPAILERLGQ